MAAELGTARLTVLSALCVGLLVAAGFRLLSPSGSGPVGNATDSGPPRPAEITAVMQLLGRHAGELMARDRTAWSADLDDAAAAADYRSRQQAVFGNLAGVPLTTWRYVLVAPVTDPAVIGPAAARLDGRAVVLHVDLQYALALVDPAPTGKGLWLTAVRRPGGWRLAADTDAARLGGPSWQGPWDFGPLVARTGPHTLVLGHPTHAGDLATFGALVERSVPVVSRVWGNGWNEHVAVLIPDTPAEFDAVTGTAASSDETAIAAVAVADSVRTDPSGSAVVLGARIVLNPTALGRLDSGGRRLVVQHELTHIATRADTSDQMPSWLIEGFADYVGNLDSGQPVPMAARELAAEVRRGVLPAALPSAADFDAGNSRLPQVYEEAWLACRLVAQRYGQPTLVRLYRQVSLAARSDPATAAATGLGQVLHLTPSAFTAAWRADLTRELAP
ncbi:MAG TPA: hypothetical protein VJ851_07115 [Jatrophihabitans sp.]|nr:hypothetical protein [Jatrophihabitans sp.]